MKNVKLLALLALLAGAHSVHAGINTGSKQAGLLVSGSAQLSAIGAGGLTLTSGTLRTTSTNATSITGTLNCNNTKLEIDDQVEDGADRSFEGTVDGTYTMATGALTLGNNQALRLEGGTTDASGAITCTGDAAADASLIEGSGMFGADISVSASSYLDIDLQSTLNVNIDNNSTGTVKLLSDLRLADGKEIDGGTVDCNGNRLIFGSSDKTLSAAQTITDTSSNANFGVEMNGKITLGGNLTLGSNGFLAGNGNVLNLAANAIDLASNNLTISDLTLANMNASLILNPGDLFLSNVTVSHVTDSLGAISINGIDDYAQVSLAATSSFFADAAVTFDNGAIIDIVKPVDLNTTWNFSATSYINGGGSRLDLAGGVLAAGSNDLYMSDVRVTGSVTGSWTGTGDIYASNLIWQEANGEARFNGTSGLAQITPTDGLLFAEDVTFTGGVRVDLLKPCTLNGSKTWTFGAASYINGGGHTFNVAAGVLDADSNNLYFSDLKLNGIVAGSIANLADVYCNNVEVSGANGKMRISGAADAADGYAQVSLTDASFFDNDVTFDDGAIIELLDDCTIASGKTWTFSADTVLHGNGNVLDLTNGRISIATGVTLSLKNVIVKGITGDTTTAGNGRITFGHATSSILEMSDVTMKLAGNLALNKGEFSVQGPMTLVTGSNVMTVTSVLRVNGVTMWYDTLGSVPSNNVTPSVHDNAIVILENSAAIKTIEPGDGSFIFPRDDRPNLVKSVDLYKSGSHVDGGANGDVDGVTMTFKTGDGTIDEFTTDDYSFDGNGRTVRFGNAEGASALWTIDSSAVDVTTRNVVLDGLMSANIDNTAGGTFTFGGGTVVRLQENDALTQGYTFAPAGQSAVLDLNGHTLDLGGNAITCAGGTLTIKNGRLTGVTGSLITGGATTGLVIFEDVDISLSGDLNWAATGGSIEFSGKNSVDGKAGAALHFNATGTSQTKGQEEYLRINTDSMLTIETGMKLKMTVLLADAGLTDRQLDHLQLVDGSSSAAHGTLNLHGGTLESAGAANTELIVNKGRLIADHRAVLAAGANTPIRLGSSTATEDAGYNDNNAVGDASNGNNDLTIELEPGTALNISSGIVKYDNFAG